MRSPVTAASRQRRGATAKSTNLQVDAYIPQQFAPEDGDKLSLYQRIEKTRSVQELRNLMEEVHDRYGRLPNEVRLLFEKKQLDILPMGRSWKTSRKVHAICASSLPRRGAHRWMASVCLSA
ncbi:MAG: TRCF domain-containing protein [Merdibacter sp.]